MTLEDYKSREKYLINYLEKMIKENKEEEIYNFSHKMGKRSAYSDILLKLKKT